MVVAVFQQQVMKPMRCLLAIQALMAVALFILAACISGKIALSVAIAGLASVAANFLFVWRLFHEMRPQAAKRIVFNFCVGEVLKLLLVMMAMLVAVNYLNIWVWPFLLTYIILQLVALFAAPWCWQQGVRG